MKKPLSLATTLSFTLFLLLFAMLFWVLPDRSFSEIENRSLTTVPRFSWKRLISGDFADEVNDYFADQFPCRDRFVAGKGLASLALGAGGNDGVLLGRDGQLATYLFDARLANGTKMSDVDAFDSAQIRAAGKAITRVGARLDVPFSVLLTGRTLDVCASAFDYPLDASDALLDAMRASVGDTVSYIDTVPLLREKYDAGEYVYYKTDHHWTTLGAYYAYREVLISFGMENDILPPEAFSQETVAQDFYGTAWSAGGMRFVSPDSLTLWLRGNEDSFSVVADGKALEGFYSLRYLWGKDKYSVFLDGTHDVVTVRKKDGEARETLLIFKDSFANAIAPFLAQHFDLVLCNLSSSRTDFTDVTSRAAGYSADRVLLLYTLENVITADRLGRLR